MRAVQLQGPIIEKAATALVLPAVRPQTFQPDLGHSNLPSPLLTIPLWALYGCGSLTQWQFSRQLHTSRQGPEAGSGRSPFRFWRRHLSQHKPASGGPFAASATCLTGCQQRCQCQHARWHDSMALRAAAQSRAHAACHAPLVSPKQTAHGRSQALHNSHSMGIRHC